MLKNPDYLMITELPGLKATREQIARLYHRYHLARQFAQGKTVLEVACGSGMGLGYIAKDAKKVVGGDIDRRNVELARAYYNDRIKIEIELMDAHNLPFPNESFDLVLLYEAIYYLREPQKFIHEAKKVLNNNGILIICTVNKDWEDFHPSPYTYKYFSVPELYELLQNKFKKVELYGAFKVETSGLRVRIISFIKRVAVIFNLIPRSLKARAYLKRIFIGRLSPLPNEVYEGMAPFEKPIQIPAHIPNKEFKIVYAVARRNQNEQLEVTPKI